MHILIKHWFHNIRVWVWVTVLSTPFNSISVTSLRSVLLGKETGVPGENHRPVACHWQTLSLNAVSSRPRLSGIRTFNVSGNIHWLHRWLYIQLPYDHDHKWLIKYEFNANLLFGFQIFWLWAYLMKVIPETHRTHKEFLLRPTNY